VKETAFCSTDSELAELRERAQRAIDENIVLIADYKFLRAWFRMRPGTGCVRLRCWMTEPRRIYRSLRKQARSRAEAW